MYSLSELSRAANWSEGGVYLRTLSLKGPRESFQSKNTERGNISPLKVCLGTAFCQAPVRVSLSQNGEGDPPPRASAYPAARILIRGNQLFKLSPEYRILCWRNSPTLSLFSQPLFLASCFVPALNENSAVSRYTCCLKIVILKAHGLLCSQMSSASLELVRKVSNE